MARGQIAFVLMCWIACGLCFGESVTYDANGRVKAIQHLDGGRVSFTYDLAGNRLTYSVESAGVAEDLDGDGMSDAWEVGLFGSTRVAGRASDYDRDGASDAEEFAGGTDPRVRNGNDNFVDRVVLTGTNMLVLGSNAHATSEAGEPEIDYGDGVGQSIWYEWMAPSDGRIVISTAGTRFDTVVGVFDGEWPNLHPVASDESEGDDDSVLMSVPVVSGTRYIIGVDSDYERENGLVKLQLEFFEAGRRVPLNISVEPPGSAEIILDPPPDGDGLYEGGEIVEVMVYPQSGFLLAGVIGPDRFWDSGELDYSSVVVGRSSAVRVISCVGLAPPNDDFEHAEGLSGDEAYAVGSNIGATAEPGEPGMPDAWGRNSVWWKWTAPLTGRALISTHGSSFDTVLGVYRASPDEMIDSLIEIDSNDGFGPDDTAVVSCPVVSGVTYWLRVGGYGRWDWGRIHVIIKVFDGAERFSLQVQSEPDLSASFSLSPAPGPGGLYAAGTLVDLRAEVGVGRSFLDIDGIDELREEVDLDLDREPASVETSLIVSTNRVVTVSTRIAGPPSNDNCGDATAIVGTNVTVTGDNSGATAEPTEPILARDWGDNSVWWKWTAPSSGRLLISTTGSAFDTVLSVYSGGSPDALTEVVSDDDSGADYASSLAFSVSDGAMYWIRVAGYNTDDSGSIQLSLKMFPAGVTFVLDADIDPANAGLVEARPESGGDMRYPAGSSVKVRGHSKRGYRFLDWSGDLSDERGDYADVVMDTNKAVVAHFAKVEAPPNDNFEDAAEIVGESATVLGHNVNASIEADEPLDFDYDGDGYTVWWKWRAPADGRLLVCATGMDTSGTDGDEPIASIFAGETLAGLTRLAYNGGMNDGGSVAVSAPVRSGELYQIAVDSDSQEGELLQLTLEFFDEVERAQVVFILDSAGSAVIEAIPPPDADGTYAAGTVVRVRATPVSGYRFLGWDGVYRELEFFEAEVVADTAKTVRVLTESGYPPGNDNFANASTLSGASASASADTTDATPEMGEPAHYWQTPKQSVWYRWTAPSDGSVTIDTDGSSFDTIIAVYTGNSVASMAAVVSDDDEPLDNGTVVRFDATAGITYYVAVDSQDQGESGPMQLHLAFTPALSRREAWRQEKFGEDAGNSAVSGGLADPDGDGIPNLMEYFMDAEPLLSNWDTLPEGAAVQSLADGKKHLTLTFQFPEDRTDVAFAVEVSDDLENWHRGNDVTEIVSDTTSNGIRTVAVRDRVAITDTRRRFIRLVVEAQWP